MADDLSPIYQGDRSPWTLQMYYRKSVTKRALTGISAANCQYKLQVASSPVASNVGTSWIGTGTISINDYTNGVMSIVPSSTDVATIGTLYLWLLVPFSSGTLQHSDPYTIQVVAAP